METDQPGPVPVLCDKRGLAISTGETMLKKILGKEFFKFVKENHWCFYVNYQLLRTRDQFPEASRQKIENNIVYAFVLQLICMIMEEPLKKYVFMPVGFLSTGWIEYESSSCKEQQYTLEQRKDLLREVIQKRPEELYHSLLDIECILASEQMDVAEYVESFEQTFKIEKTTGKQVYSKTLRAYLKRRREDKLRRRELRENELQQLQILGDMLGLLHEVWRSKLYRDTIEVLRKHSDKEREYKLHGEALEKIQVSPEEVEFSLLVFHPETSKEEFIIQIATVIAYLELGVEQSNPKRYISLRLTARQLQKYVITTLREFEPYYVQEEMKQQNMGEDAESGEGMDTNEQGMESMDTGGEGVRQVGRKRAVRRTISIVGK